jgi:uncharacterized protein DUF742
VSDLPRPSAATDFVRPFVITGGRTRAVDTSLRMETLVHTAAGASGRATFEHARILEVCRQPTSIAEVAAKVGVPLGVATVLVADLVDRGSLSVHDSDPVEIELDALTRMINRVRTL